MPYIFDGWKRLLTIMPLKNYPGRVPTGFGARSKAKPSPRAQVPRTRRSASLP